MLPKHFTYFLGCSGVPQIALLITLICGVLFSDSRWQSSEIANSLLLAISLLTYKRRLSGDRSLPNPEASPAPARLAGACVCDPLLGWPPDRC